MAKREDHKRGLYSDPNKSAQKNAGKAARFESRDRKRESWDNYIESLGILAEIMNAGRNEDAGRREHIGGDLQHHKHSKRYATTQALR